MTGSYSYNLRLSLHIVHLKLEELIFSRKKSLLKAQFNSIAMLYFCKSLAKDKLE